MTITEACAHPAVEPVKLLDGTTVADVCTRCLAALESGYRCTGCHWIEDTEWLTFADAAAGVRHRSRTYTCPAHRNTTQP